MKGKCLCGQVEFQLKGELPNLYQCHCTLCKKATGSSSCSAVVIDEHNIEWLNGSENINSYTNENGFRTDFCKTCGSPVPNKMNIGPYVWVPAGLLESPVGGKVAAHIFMESKASWEEEAEHAHHYEKGPEDVHAFMKALFNESPTR